MGRYEDLEKLNKLKEQGSITDKEFEMEKYKILSSEENKNDNKTNGTYSASIAIGIIAFLLGAVPVLGIILSIVGIVLCNKAKKIMKQNGDTNGSVTAGLILSILGLIIGLAFTIIPLGVYITNSQREPIKINDYSNTSDSNSYIIDNIKEGDII